MYSENKNNEYIEVRRIVLHVKVFTVFVIDSKNINVLVYCTIIRSYFFKDFPSGFFRFFCCNFQIQLKRSETPPGYDVPSLKMNNNALAFHLIFSTLTTFNNIVHLFD